MERYPRPVDAWTLEWIKPFVPLGASNAGSAFKDLGYGSLQCTWQIRRLWMLRRQGRCKVCHLKFLLGEMRWSFDTPDLLIRQGIFQESWSLIFDHETLPLSPYPSSDALRFTQATQMPSRLSCCHTFLAFVDSRNSSHTLLISSFS